MRGGRPAAANRRSSRSSTAVVASDIVPKPSARLRKPLSVEAIVQLMSPPARLTRTPVLLATRGSATR
jgi:hypothetical protein